MFRLLILAATLACAALTGCGSIGAEDSSSSSTSSSTSSSASSSSSSNSSSSGASSVFPPSVTRPKIMIVGDSISAGPGCYKKYLDQNLKNGGVTNYEFVGEYSDDCGGNIRHSAVSCTTTEQYTRSSFTVSPQCSDVSPNKGMLPLMQAHNPDLVMIQLGVNDIWGGTKPIVEILNNYTKLVEQARQHNPRIVVVTAQIHKVRTDNCTNENSYELAKALVQAVPAWAERTTTVESPVFVADLWTNSNPMDANDCVHPDDEGAIKMGQNWYDALEALLR